MKIEALNCPNCGAGALSDYARCNFCETRLKTVACPSCFGLMFIGSQHCSHCGEKVVQAETAKAERSGDCPRCKIALNSLQIQEISLLECLKCGGFWSDSETFENICAERESQANVLGFIGNKHFPKTNIAINYVPCPDCKQLMNRNNFARFSGVILDICKQHGVWFDAEELPKIIEFIRRGGLDHARHKEKIQLQEQRRELADKQRQITLENRRFQQSNLTWSETDSLSIRGFVKLLFD
ncbi:MAG: zf-TFIIB domain-containing protein [Acidobacteriota bacterium]